MNLRSKTYHDNPQRKKSPAAFLSKLQGTKYHSAVPPCFQSSLFPGDRLSYAYNVRSRPDLLDPVPCLLQDAVLVPSGGSGGKFAAYLNLRKLPPSGPLSLQENKPLLCAIHAFCSLIPLRFHHTVSQPKCQYIISKKYGPLSISGIFRRPFGNQKIFSPLTSFLFTDSKYRFT